MLPVRQLLIRSNPSPNERRQKRLLPHGIHHAKPNRLEKRTGIVERADRTSVEMPLFPPQLLKIGHESIRPQRAFVAYGRGCFGIYLSCAMWAMKGFPGHGATRQHSLSTFRHSLRHLPLAHLGPLGASRKRRQARAHCNQPLADIDTPRHSRHFPANPCKVVVNLLVVSRSVLALEPDSLLFQQVSHIVNCRGQLRCSAILLTIASLCPSG